MFLSYALLFLGSAAAGILALYGVVAFLPRRLARENAHQRTDLLKTATAKAKQIKNEQIKRMETSSVLAREELEEQIKERTENLKAADEELNDREQFIANEENRLKHYERELALAQTRVETQKTYYTEAKNALDTVTQECRSKLQIVANQEASALAVAIKENLVESRRLEAQKVLKSVSDDLNLHAKKYAQRMLARTMARYAPEFPWPKAVNHVEIQDRRLVDVLSQENCPIIQQAKELAGVEIELILSERPDVFPILKLAGGAGMQREAARLALGEVLPKGESSWAKLADAFNRHRIAIEKQASELGKQAAIELNLPDLHPEIQKMVGSLNWRTSYRQNQYLHTVEVAKLAGILATEAGVDPQLGKRVGLLHDIGKALDYRIEGSHAVISGDYADRFGETRLVCDTVMSHHNDLLVESPLAYVLRAADTLSGARPGARVNLEEGYQIRLSAIDDVVRAFPGVGRSAIMNGGREVHIDVNNKKISDADLESLASAIARRIEKEVAFPGQIKVLVSRRFEAVSVA